MKHIQLLTGLFILASATFAAPVTVISATGTGNGQAVADWIGESWTQTGTYTNVSISATLNGGVALPTTAYVYLMNQLGPGTSVSNQIAYEQVSIPARTSGATLFTGLTLGPGTYFLLADEVDAGWTGSNSPMYTTDTGITNISSFMSTGPIAGYAPDTSYQLTSGAYLFSVTGTPAAAASTPEPATFGMILLFAPLLFLARSVKRSPLKRTANVAAFALFSALAFSGKPASAEDCFNGPVPVPAAHRGQITIPKGQAVRLTFTFSADWENEVYVCDALTGELLMTKGNYSRNREDWVSPIDNTRSLSYYVVAFHKTVSPNAGDAGSHPWFSSPLKRGPRITVQGQSGAYVDSYGFNDGGGIGWNNSLVTAYFIGKVGVAPKALPASVIEEIRAKLR